MGGQGSVWGEGCVDDSWTQVARVDRWDLVHPDEMLRLFPALIAASGQSALLIGRLEQALAVRWHRLRVRAGGHGLRLESFDANALTRLAEAHEAAWFPLPGPLQSAMDRLLGTGPGFGAENAGEEAAVLALDDLLTSLRAGSAVAYAEPRALSLTFYAGIHPAYVWSEALALHDCATAIGWLGVVARGHGALLPPDIAATLADSIAESAQGAGRPRDKRFAFCGLTPLQWGSIGRAARQCLAGKRDIVRLRHDTRLSTVRAKERDAPRLPTGSLHRFVLGAMSSTRAGRRAS